MKNLGQNNILEYERVKKMKMVDIMGYLDVAEKEDRYKMIIEQEEKVTKIEEQFTKKAPEKIN